MEFPFPQGSAQMNANDENFPSASEINDGAAIWGTWPCLNGDPQRPPLYPHPGQYPQPQQFSEFLSVGPGTNSLRVPSTMTRENSHMSIRSGFSGPVSLDSQSPYQQPEMPHNSLPINTSFVASISSQGLRARLNEILILISSGSDSEEQLLPLFDEGASILRKLTQADVGHEPDLKRQISQQNKMYRCISCCSNQTYKSKGTIKRHALVDHYHEIEFHCGICPKPTAPEAWQYRKDKFNDHMMNKHEQQISNADNYIQAQWRVPSECPLPTCRAAMASWEEFWKHFCQHCEIPVVVENQAPGRDGGGRRDNGDRNNGRGGHQFQPPPNNGDFGNPFGNIQPGYYGSNGGGGNGDMGYGGGPQWAYTCNATDSSSTPVDLVDSQSPEPEGSVPALTARPKPLSIQKGQERRQLGIDTAPETARRTEASEKLENILPRTELDKKRDDSPVKDTDDKEGICGSCKHTIAGCPRCAQLVAAPIKCHQCADKSCEKAHTGSNIAGVRLSDIPGCNFPWDITRKDGAKNPMTFSNVDFTEARKLVSKRSASLTDDIEYTGISEMVFSLQIHDSDTKRSTEEDPTSLQKAESPIDTDFPPGLYFERYLYTTQSQGSFLQYVHETLIFPEPHRFIVSSFQEIVYWEASMGSDKQLEVPGEQLFYLAREKDHESSEANLKMARQSSPKRRAHLRVRVRVIAGVLALRAAVSKSPPVAGNIEAGDGWELGIPLRALLPTRDKMMMGVTYVVYFLAFCLRLTDPHIYLSTWADSDWDGLLLT